MWVSGFIQEMGQLDSQFPNFWVETSTRVRNVWNEKVKQTLLREILPKNAKRSLHLSQQTGEATIWSCLSLDNQTETWICLKHLEKCQIIPKSHGLYRGKISQITSNKPKETRFQLPSVYRKNNQVTSKRREVEAKLPNLTIS